MSSRATALLCALLLSSAASPARPSAGSSDLLNGSVPLALKLEAPLQELFAKGSEDENFSVAGRLSYKDPGTGADVTRDAQVSVRGHTSRRETECAFPKLKLKFKDGGDLRIGTHCGEASDATLSPKYGRLANEKSPQREVVAYRLLEAADVPTLRTRPASITYVDTGQAPFTRHGLLVEDDSAARKRVKGTADIPMEKFGSVSARGAAADAARIAFGEAMIGNFDWCLKFSPDDAYHRPVVARNDVPIYLHAARSNEACKPKDMVPPGTPVNEVQRSGSMSQVVILDALWRWTAERRCETVQTSPVWIQSDAITRDYPSKH